MILSQILSRILRSLRRPSNEGLDPLFSAGFLVGIIFFSSCASTKHVETIPLETICDHQVHDTLYINKVQYDSIYVSQNHYVDRGKDTILIRQHDIEYRYKLLRDTIERIKLEIRHDSIPYEVTIIETKEITRPLTWFDKTCRACFFFLFGFLILWFFKKIGIIKPLSF